MYILAELTRTIADDYVIDFGLVAILGVKLLLGCSDEILIEVVAYEVDCATTEATTHDAATGYLTLLGDVVKEVELLTRHLIVF